jgi:hypothetical protein
LLFAGEWDGVAVGEQLWAERNFGCVELPGEQQRVKYVWWDE